MMPVTVKIQRIGNSLRATIPKEAAEALALKQGEEVVVNVLGDSVVLQRKHRVNDLTRFYGILQKKTGEVERWPRPEEIKDIWE